MWLGWLDSNQRMSAPKADALPLGDTPTIIVVKVDISIGRDIFRIKKR